MKSPVVFKTKIYLVFMFLLSLSLGSLYLVINPDSITPQHDALTYDTIGWNLAQGQGYSLEDHTPTVIREPTYPYFLASIYFVAGHNYKAVRIVQIFINALNALLVFFVGKELFDKRSSIIAAILYAVYPAFLLYTGLILTEIVFTFLLLGSTLFLIYAVKRFSLLSSGASGLFLGLATLCRPVTLLYPVLLCFIFIFKKERRKLMQLVAILTIIMALVLLPWTIRNMVAFGRFMPVSARSGYQLFLGTLPPDTSSLHIALGEDFSTNPVEKDREVLLQALSHIISYPTNYILQMPHKLVYFLLPEGTSVIGSIKTPQGLILVLAQLLILFFALIGGIINRFSVSSLIVKSLILYFVGVHMLLVSVPRYNMPIMPYILIFSVAGFLPTMRYFLDKFKRDST